MNLTRRNAIRAASAIVPAALLVACGVATTTTVNGVTTVTVDVAKVNAYAQAGSNFADAILTNPLITAFILPYSAVITAAKAVIVTDLAAFNKGASGSVVLTFNANSVPLMVSSVLTDLQALAADVVKALPATAIVGTVESDIAALAALISLFEAMLGVTPVASVDAASSDSEKAALATLGVK
jgi:hypothetical protein